MSITLKNTSLKFRENMETFLFTIPALILVTIMIYLPFVMSGYYSFTKWDGISKAPEWIGIGNFVEIFSKDNTFIPCLIFTIVYTILFILLVNVSSLALAVALVKKFKAVNVLRAVFFIPYIISLTIVGFIWKFIFTQGFEAFYNMAKLPFLTWSWLGESKLAFFSIVIVGVWQSVGFYMILYIAGLKAIPEEVLEAATVEGATNSQRFFKVVLPLLGPSLTTCIFMSLTNGLKVFDIILALTKGGPGGSTYSSTLDIYRDAFQNNTLGIGSAKALIFFFIVLIMTQVVLKIASNKEV